jgi:hypothetical protein
MEGRRMHDICLHVVVYLLGFVLGVGSPSWALVAFQSVGPSTEFHMHVLDGVVICAGRGGGGGLV